MKMKQIKFAGAVMAAVLMLLTSCLGDTGNSGQIPTFGKVRYSSGKLLIDTPYGTIYSTQLSPLEYYDGDWMFINYAYDYGIPENTNYEANGYLYVTLLETPTMIPEGQVYTSSDTTKLLTNEFALTSAAAALKVGGLCNYMEGDWLMTSLFKELTDVGCKFEMYYDYNQESVSYDGKNTYTFYVRAIKTDEGKTPAVDQVITNYYTIKSYIDFIDAKEKSAGNTSFNLAFRYVSEIDAETGEFTWTTDTPVAFAVTTTE